MIRFALKIVLFIILFVASRPLYDSLGVDGLPGDFLFVGEGGKMQIPVTTCVVISLLVSFIFRLFDHKRG